MTAIPLPVLSARQITSLRIAVIFVMAACIVYSAWYSRHWQLMIDSPIMHYIVFMMKHGLRPYADITDNNMPGAYISEAMAMGIFGSGDGGWRVFEYFLLLALGGAMIAIARPYDWVAGVFAAGWFAMMHVSEGPWVAGEREEVIAALLMAGCATMFVASRHRRIWLLIPSGACFAFAASIKPTFLPAAFIALMFIWSSWRRHIGSPRIPMLWFCVGSVSVVLIDLLFLVAHGSLASFVYVVRHVLAVYAALPSRVHSRREMLLLSTPRTILVLVLLAAATWWRQRHTPRWNAELSTLAAMAALGLTSYFLQGKGFEHHRYTWIAFLLTVVSIQLFRSLRENGRSALVAATAILFGLFFVLPGYLRALRTRPAKSGFLIALESDLTAMNHVSPMQYNVRCFDMVYGCLNALEHLQIMQNSGYTGDLLFFVATDSESAHMYRSRFWRELNTDPPTVFIISNEWFGHEDSFDKLTAWPEFQDYLRSHYTLITERVFPTELVSKGSPLLERSSAPAYRIYVLKPDARRLAASLPMP